APRFAHGVSRAALLRSPVILRARNGAPPLTLVLNRAHGYAERTMNPVDTLFQRLHAKKRKAFIPFVTAGDPDLQTTQTLIAELARRGASLIEVGFAYSDPVA